VIWNVIAEHSRLVSALIMIRSPCHTDLVGNIDLDPLAMPSEFKSESISAAK